jgi:hypothetical protein
LLLGTAGSSAAEPPLPISSGRYEFGHRFAEYPNIISSTKFIAIIDGYHITLTNEGRTDVFPAGLIEEGTLMWHEPSQQWIIGSVESDRESRDVGGCSDGPRVVDLMQRVYWTC